MTERKVMTAEEEMDLVEYVAMLAGFRQAFRLFDEAARGNSLVMDLFEGTNQ